MEGYSVGVVLCFVDFGPPNTADCATLPPTAADHRTRIFRFDEVIPPIALYGTINGRFSHAHRVRAFHGCVAQII